MKQIVWLYAVLGFLSLNAFELEVDMGTGVYYTGAKGNLLYAKETWAGSTANIDHSSTPSVYVWSEFTTDQAYWPKLRVEFSHSETEGNSFIHIGGGPGDLIDKIEGELGGFVTLNNTDYDSTLVQNTYEAYLYYEYFEKSAYPSVGIGAGVKNFDFTYRATLIEGLEFTDNGGDTIPLLFFKSRYELDNDEDAQLAFEVNAKYFIFGESNIYDYSIKGDFMMAYNNTTDLGFEFGYRYTFIDIKGDDIDTVGGDMSTSGVFVGLVAQFR